MPWTEGLGVELDGRSAGVPPPLFEPPELRLGLEEPRAGVERLALRRVVAALLARRVVVALLLELVEEAGTGVTSTVVLAAELEAEVATRADAAAEVGVVLLVDADAAALERRRGVGVAMTRRGEWDERGKGLQLSIRTPVINDSADCEIGEDRVIGTGVPGRRSAGRENPVAFTGTDGIHCHHLLAFVVLENAQVHVIQTRHAVGADHGSHYLHDLHQPAAPLGVEGVDAAGGVVGFGGSGSQ